MTNAINLDIFKNANSLFTEQKENALMDQIAKLLAKENIIVVYGDFKTASFNILSRVMQIPNWSNVPRALKFRLRLHEMGHALFTEMNDFHHEMVMKYGRTMAHYINVVEDDRVDRFTLLNFPGARNYVIEGSAALFERGFFGTTDLEKCKTMIFIDRLNINSKMGSSVFPMILLNETEAKLYQRFKTTKTLTECIELANDILTYAKSQETKVPSTITMSSEEFDKMMQESQDLTDENEEDTDDSDAVQVQVQIISDEKNSDEDDVLDEPPQSGESENSDEGEESDANSGSGESDNPEETEGDSGEKSDSDSDFEESDEEDDGKSKVEQEKPSAGTNAGERIDSVESETDKAYRNAEEKLENSVNVKSDEFIYTIMQVPGKKDKKSAINVKGSQFLAVMKNHYKI